MDRRKHPRLIGPFSASFAAAAGQPRACRVGDISLGGCFVHTLHPPRGGEQALVSIDLGDGNAVSLSGTVVYEEWCDGFALKFGAMSPGQLSALKDLMGRLRSIRKTA